MSEIKFIVIGIDDNPEQCFPSFLERIIQQAIVFSGGIRHHEIMKSYLPEEYHWISIVTPLDEVFRQYAFYQEIVVFASGDPLFFGFVHTIQKRLPSAAIKVYPSFNSLQLLAHRLLLPYQDMHVVSLTGRPWDKLDEVLISGYSKIGVLTDREHTPATIAGRMQEYGYTNYQLTVGELLGNPAKEKVQTFTLQEVTDKEFAFPNTVILQKMAVRRRPLGIPETDFHLLDGRTRMITKMPVRLLSLSLLDLRDKQVFWDIGFCTGSVSIEAKMQFPHLKIFAFEKREQAKAVLEKNMRTLGTPGIIAITGDFITLPVAAYEQPDTVFIGGHGGKLHAIISKIKSVLRPGGSIVFNSVSADSRTLFMEAAERNQLEIEKSIHIQVDAYNPIEVIKAIHPLT
ncbi:MAG: precorrin-6y C5,15-methyltransferase (decarboxylating) subunit CbiE [Tannerellaceae bacterium]|nr:precorrin-6y C5,15-methyltransferase (decarboxylating) subunit CbiE [Tannerellaceae bacterium]